MSGTTNVEYRDEFVSIIKDIGKELIDRAGEMVSQDATFIKDFHISIDIPNPREEDPTITWCHSTLCTNYLNRKDPGLGLKSRCIKEKKAYWGRTYDPIRNERRSKCSNCGFTVVGSAAEYMTPDTCPGCDAIMESDT